MVSRCASRRRGRRQQRPLAAAATGGCCWAAVAAARGYLPCAARCCSQQALPGGPPAAGRPAAASRSVERSWEGWHRELARRCAKIACRRLIYLGPLLPPPAPASSPHRRLPREIRSNSTQRSSWSDPGHRINSEVWCSAPMNMALAQDGHTMSRMPVATTAVDIRCSSSTTPCLSCT